MAPSYRPRRTCLAVPGSSSRFLEKTRAAGLARTQAFDPGAAEASAEHSPGGERLGQATGQG